MELDICALFAWRIEFKGEHGLGLEGVHRQVHEVAMRSVLSPKYGIVESVIDLPLGPQLATHAKRPRRRFGSEGPPLLEDEFLAHHDIIEGNLNNN